MASVFIDPRSMGMKNAATESFSSADRADRFAPSALRGDVQIVIARSVSEQEALIK